MPKTLKYRFLLPVAFLILSNIQGSFAMEQSSQRLVSPELLERVGLKIMWENILPTKPGENLERLLILGDQIYAISDKSYMLCLQRESNKRVFGKTVELGGLKVEELSLYNDKLLSVSGDRMYEIDPNTGIEHSTIDVEYGIVCPAARNDSFVYLGGADRRLHALRAEDKVQVFKVAADNDSMITTVIADPGFVIFGTDKGNIISILPDVPVKSWQFDASGAIVGSIIRDGMSLYFAGEDMNVYRLDIVGTPERRRLIWKYQTDGILNTSPCVTRRAVYQVVYGKGLEALNKDDGTLLWSVQSGTGFLAEAKDKAYVITKDGTLVVMDNDTNKRLHSVNFAGVSIHAANTVDSKIYIADKSGRIACLQPLE
jgi:outer membrane protein assembly factor BamB